MRKPIEPPPPPSPPASNAVGELLTVSEFVRVSGLSRATVFRRIRDGAIPIWQPGGHRTALRIPANVLVVRQIPEADDSTARNATASKRGRRPEWMAGPMF